VSSKQLISPRATILPCLAVYEGLLLSTPDKFANAEQFLRLWRNEALRVFHDRLISPEDKHMVCSQISEIVEQYFEPCATHTLADPILFGDYRCVPVLWAPLGSHFGDECCLLQLPTPQSVHPVKRFVYYYHKTPAKSGGQ